MELIIDPGNKKAAQLTLGSFFMEIFAGLFCS